MGFVGNNIMGNNVIEKLIRLSENNIANTAFDLSWSVQRMLDDRLTRFCGTRDKTGQDTIRLSPANANQTLFNGV